MPLSRITVGTLADMGYTVNYNGADSFGRALFSGACVCNRRLEEDGLVGSEEEVDGHKTNQKKEKKQRRMNDAYTSALEDAKQILRDMQAEPTFEEAVGSQVESVVGDAVAYLYYDAEDESFHSLIVTKDDLA